MKLGSRLLALFAVLWTAPVHAASFGSMVDDKSIEYLGLLFGKVGAVLPFGQGSDLFAYMVGVFNVIVMTFSVVVLTYVTFMALVNTAQEGEMMGRKWSSLWIPMRSALGMGLLVPLPTGFNLIQMIVISIIVLGVHMANQLWYTVLDMYDMGYSLNQTESMVEFPPLTISDDPHEASGIPYRLLHIAVCREQLRKEGKEPTVTHLPFLGSAREVRLDFGSAERPQSCGTVRLEAPPSQWNPDNITQDFVTDAIRLAYYESSAEAIKLMVEGYFGLAAEEALYHSFEAAGPRNPTLIQDADQTLVGIFSTIKATLDTAVASQKGTGQQAGIIERAKHWGWIYAGIHYFALRQATGSGQKLNPFNKGTVMIQLASPNDKQPTYNPEAAAINTFYSAYIKRVGGQTATSAVADIMNYNMVAASSGGAGNKAFVKFYNESFGKPFKDMTYKIMRNMTGATSKTGLGNDPILALVQFGTTVLSALETLVVTYVLATFGVTIVLGFAPGISGVPDTIVSIVTLIGSLLMFFVTLLAGGGIMFAVYIPLIPVTLFTFGALSWFIAAIEAMISAPIVALGLTIPAQDGLGRATPALSILLNLFLRPPLMVFGFVAGARLLMVAFEILRTTFAPMLYSVSGAGIFSFIAVIAVYATVCVTVTNECWSLIHILPDRVIRWIGGQPDQSSVASNAHNVQGTHDVAAKSATAAATAAVKAGGNALGQEGGFIINALRGNKDSISAAEETPPPEDGDNTVAAQEGSEGGAPPPPARGPAPPPSGNKSPPTGASSGGGAAPPPT